MLSYRASPTWRLYKGLVYWEAMEAAILEPLNWQIVNIALEAAILEPLNWQIVNIALREQCLI